MIRSNGKIICCPDCKSTYPKLEFLNKHISKTGCNNGDKITLGDLLKVCGVISDSNIDLQTVILAI